MLIHLLLSVKLLECLLSGMHPSTGVSQRVRGAGISYHYYGHDLELASWNRSDSPAPFPSHSLNYLIIIASPWRPLELLADYSPNLDLDKERSIFYLPPTPTKNDR